MSLLEKKIDIVLQWIVCSDATDAEELKKNAAELLKIESKKVKPSLKNAIEDLLTEIGVSRSNLGFYYLTEAIRLMVEDRNKYLRAIHKGLYVDICKTFPETTPARIERCIRHAIETAFENGDMEYMRDLFGGCISKDTGKISNAGFIITCAVEIEKRMKEGLV